MGYGLLGGIGWGLMYLSPVTTVMKWFPDKRGLATGIALSAFGAGAAIAPGIIHSLLDVYAVAPEFIGPLADIQSADVPTDQFVKLTTLLDGSQVIGEDSPLGVPGQHVVVATEGDLAKVPNIETGPGVYELGTGDTGVAKALGSLGLGCGVMGVLGSRFMMLPHANWTPNGPIQQEEEDNKKDETPVSNDIGLPVSYVTTSTTQFPLLWLTVFGNATGGLALLSSSKLMITDIWAGMAPTIVTTSFATGYVATLGVGMAAGRFGWSTLSDYLGRKNTYALFGLAIPVVGFAPFLTHAASVSGPDGNILPLLATFYGGSFLALTFYGGIFSTLPAYIADLFGQKYSGAIHGKLLTAWAGSAVVGPMGLAYMRSRSVDQGIDNLLGVVQDKGAFEQTFGCALEDTETIQTLIDAKTITIARLVELAPVGTLDPTPFLYDSTCYAAAGLMGVSFLANLAIRPLDYVKLVEELEAKEHSSATTTEKKEET
jgi:MFS family permease